MPAVIVFSHLRWDFVFHRPQHVLSRVAHTYPVVFVEAPIFDAMQSGWEITTPIPNLFVCRLRTTIADPGFHNDQLPQLRTLMRQLALDYADHIAWFYTPMALPLLQELHPRAVVYDSPDELAGFAHAPEQWLQREDDLLNIADIVFVSGPCLYRSMRKRHSNVHCAPSSVDAMHFERALDRGTSHPAHNDIPGPRLGFYGVIDDRLDAVLIDQLADARPNWQIVLVGPIVRTDPASLPHRANIHYLGAQTYQMLPQFLAGWDACLLPFVLNESTRCISPSQMLEYMAAGLPVVSTPVADVVDGYGDVVYIAHDAHAFIAACGAALTETTEQRASHADKMRAMVSGKSWDRTAAAMLALIEGIAASRTVVPPWRDVTEADTKSMPLRNSCGQTGASAAELVAVGKSVSTE